MSEEQYSESKDVGRKISFFEKLLPIWIIMCMALGIFLSIVIPAISEAINSWQVRGISIPIGICLFFMMYPAMLNLQAAEIKKLGKNPKPIIITLVANWIIAPIIGITMAILFLEDEQLIFAIILLTSSPCTAMVLVWGWMAKGNQEQNVITTSINTATIIILYIPVIMLLVFIANITLEKDIPLDPVLLLISLFIFIGAPLLLGILSKKVLTKTKGEETNAYRTMQTQEHYTSRLLQGVCL